MTLLHRVQTTFTQPLYPAFEVWRVGSSVNCVIWDEAGSEGRSALIKERETLQMTTIK
uniref:Uncharacterized protein n=1 Tax=Anguilla anguilla TaxID=7936 RepID=A0A0E9T204_ANGAN